MRAYNTHQNNGEIFQKEPKSNTIRYIPEREREKNILFYFKIFRCFQTFSIQRKYTHKFS